VSRKSRDNEVAAPRRGSRVRPTRPDEIARPEQLSRHTQLIGRPHLMRRLTQGSGVFIAGLGLSLALARRPANG